MQLQASYILHANKYRETSLLIRLFNEDMGILGTVAKGALRANNNKQSLLQPFQPLNCRLSGKTSLYSLYNPELDSWQPPLPSKALIAGLYANELLIRLCAEGDPHPKSYLAYCELLEALRNKENRIDDSLRIFEWRIFADIGYALDTSKDKQGKPLQAQHSYILDDHWHFIQIDGSYGVHYQGEQLLAIHSKKFHLCRTTAKKLSREIISRIIGSNGLQSWKMFRQS